MTAQRRRRLLTSTVEVAVDQARARGLTPERIAEQLGIGVADVWQRFGDQDDENEAPETVEADELATRRAAKLTARRLAKKNKKAKK